MNPPADGTEGPVAGASSAPLTPRVELLITVGILLALLMGALDNFVALTALPTILFEFGQPNSGTFVISAYVIASTASIPIFAKLSDLWSRRNVFLGGLVGLHRRFGPLGAQPEPHGAHHIPRNPRIWQWRLLPGRDCHRRSGLSAQDPREGHRRSLGGLWHRGRGRAAHRQRHCAVHHLALGVLREHPNRSRWLRAHRHDAGAASSRTRSEVRPGWRGPPHRVGGLSDVPALSDCG